MTDEKRNDLPTQLMSLLMLAMLCVTLLSVVWMVTR